MARKGKKRGKIEVKEVVKSEMKSKKKDGLHDLNKLKFESRTQEKVYDRLIIEYLERHHPKIMDIVPTEIREKRGDGPNQRGKLYKSVVQTVNTNSTYLKRMKTFIKWHVTTKGISSLGEINGKTTDEFFSDMAKNIGPAKHEYSKKTYDSYVDGTYKLFQALSTRPEDAKVQLEGRVYAEPLQSAARLLDRDFKSELRNKIDQYSKEEYKRGSGYSTAQASGIMNQAEKYLNTKEQLLVATLVFGGVRNDEAQQFKLDFYKKEKNAISLLEKGVTKQDRGRVILDVHPKVFELVEKLRKEEGISSNVKIFEGYNDEKVRQVVKNCCTHAKIKYSGVHDLRKPFLEKSEREWISRIKKGEVTKTDLVERIMYQIGVKDSLNPLVKVKESRYRMTQDGKRQKYYVYKRIDGKIVEERKFSTEKLEKMNIEDLLDHHMAEQLGHSDPETTYDYRLPKAAIKRSEFRKQMRNARRKAQTS